MANFTQNAVSRTAWPWQAEKTVGAPAAGTLRRRALIQVTVMAAVAALFFLYWRKPVAGALVATLAGWTLAASLLWPAAFAATERFFARFGHWVGVALTYLLLVPFFYLCFVPGRFFLRLTGKDPLQLQPEPQRPSYWDARAPVTDPVTHFSRQY